MVYVKNKQKIKYICLKYFKDYQNDKYGYNLHIKRIFPCKKNNNNVNYNNDIPNDKDNLVFELMKKIYLIIKQNQKKTM